MALGQGPDIFGFDEPAPADPWAEHRARQERLGIVPAAPVPEEAPVPGVDVDSMGRAWADVPKVNTAGEVTKERRQLAPEEVKQRRAQWIQDEAAKQGVDLDAPARDMDEARKKGILLRANEKMLALGAPEVAAGMAAQGGEAFNQAFDLAGMQVAKPSKPNPLKPIRERGAAAAQEAIGEQRVAREAVGDATISQEQAISEVLAQQSLRNDIEMAAQQDRERLAAERHAEQVSRVQEAEVRVQKASDDLARKPDIDPGRYWANLSAGRKAAYVITAILGGLGGVDTTSIYADAVQRDIDAQKANRDQAKAVLDARKGEFDVARQTFDDMLALTGDQRAAEAMYEASRWQAGKADLAAKAAEFGVPLTAANVAQAMAEFDERIAEATMRWQQLVATTPARVGGGLKSPFTPMQQRLLEARGKAGLESQQAFGKQAIDIAGEQETERIKASGGDAEAQQKLLRGEGGVYREAQKFAAATEEAQAVDAMVTDLLAEDDIAGYGFTGSPLPNAVSPGAKTTETKLKLIQEALGRMQSGGAITEDELETFSGLVEGGTALGGESRLRKNLGEVQKMIRARIGAHERALSPEARAFVRRNENLSDFDPQYTGSERQVVTED